MIPTLETDSAAPLRANAGYRPKLDTAARPNVDASRVMDGMRGLVAANKAQEVDPSSFVNAAGAPAKAVAAGLDVVSKLAEARMRANEEKAMLEFDSDVDIANASFDQFKSKNQTNTAAWKPEAEKIAAGVLKKWADPAVRGSVREKMHLRLNTWSKTLGINAETQGAATDFEVTKRAGLTRSSDLRAMGRVKEAADLIPRMKESGVFFPHELEHEHNLNLMAGADLAVKQLNAESTRLASMGDYAGAKALISSAEKPEAMAEDQWQRSKEGALRGLDKQQQDTDANMLLNDNPKLLQDLLTMPDKFTALSPQEKSDLQVKADGARERAAQMQVQEAKRALDLLPADKLKDAKPEALGVELDQLTPWHRKVVEQDIAIRQGSASLDDEGQYLDDLSQVEQYDAERDPQGTAAARAELAFASRYSEGGPYYKRLMDKLKAKLEPDESASPALEAAKASIFQSAEQAAMVPEMIGGKQVVEKPKDKLVAKEVVVSGFSNTTRWLTAPFGGLLLPTAQYGPNGETVAVKENNGKPVPVTRKDEVLLKASQAKAKAVTEQLEREYANPETRKKWDADSVLIERRKLELMRAANLPAMPNAAMGPSAALFPVNAEQLAKGSK